METINLAGKWEFKLDSQNIGLDQQWFDQVLENSIALPGTTDESGYGETTQAADSLRLSRKKRYTGAAWYRKQIVIPPSWAGKRLTLYLERCMWETRVWVDGQPAGSRNSLSAAHVYDLTQWLTPGTHAVSIRVDNTAQVDLGAWSHGWSEEVQTIWNGIVGKVELRVTDSVFIKNVKIYPDAPSRKAVVEARIENHTGEAVTGTLSFQAELPGSGSVGSAVLEVESGDAAWNISAELELGDKVRLWDEFEPNLYELTTSLNVSTSDGTFRSKRQDRFGIRDFKAEGSRFRLNDYYIFLRGTHDAGNFPLTGYPAMDKAHWLHIYETAKSYGLNHFRFHSWCPPEAAFEAADEAGIILQAELPLFSIGAIPIGADAARDSFLREELEQILETYGNHPSFCMMCMGNELKGDYEILDSFVRDGRQLDARHLYSTAANNAAEPSAGIQPRSSEDFYVAHEARVDGVRHLRRCELIFHDQFPETMGDFGYTLDGIDIPTVSHEVGQWAVYPNFREIEKYTGVLEPRNLQQFRSSLEANGMTHQADDFLLASGTLSLALYREEIERSLRTPHYGGFQLLDIHDYPGQGTALVGILDAFWDSKGLVTPDRFRRFCDAVVPLLRMPKRVFRNNESFTAIAELSNYSRTDLRDLTVRWVLKNSSGIVKASGSFENVGFEQGTVSHAGTIEVSLTGIEKAERLTIELSIDQIHIANDWDIWVYPEEEGIAGSAEMIITKDWNEEVERNLTAGRSVLFIATQTENGETSAFTTPFWNTQLFPNQPKTMGLLCDPQHEALSDFPTASHTDWQWWDALVGAKAVDLTKAPSELTPIVQAIDHPVRNRKLGMLFECAVGEGRLLVSGFDLMSNMENRPAARQLLSSLLAYMGGEGFRPECRWQLDAIREVLRNKEKNQLGTLVKTIRASSYHWTGNVKHLIDGNPDTYWMSGDTACPHEIVIELDREVTVKGFLYKPLQDGRSIGRIADYAWYVSRDPDDFGEPVVEGTFDSNADPKRIQLGWVNDGFNSTRSKQGKYIRFVARSCYGDIQMATIAEMDIITE